MAVIQSLTKKHKNTQKNTKKNKKKHEKLKQKKRKTQTNYMQERFIFSPTHSKSFASIKQPLRVLQFSLDLYDHIRSPVCVCRFL